MFVSQQIRNDKCDHNTDARISKCLANKTAKVDAVTFFLYLLRSNDEALQDMKIRVHVEKHAVPPVIHIFLFYRDFSNLFDYPCQCII